MWKRNYASIYSIKSNPLTLILLILNCVIYFIMELSSESISFSQEIVFKWGGLYTEYSLWDEPWRLLSSAFVHYSLSHLFGNMLCLLIWGALIERLLGTASLFILYTMSILVASIFTMIFLDDCVSAGASGGIMGLLGALVWLRLKGITVVSWNYLLLNLFINIFLDLSLPEINVAAHVGGAICGFTMGIVLSIQRKKMIQDEPTSE